MNRPMTPIELIASAFTLLAAGSLFWWGASHLITWAVEIYARYAPMRAKNQGKDHG